MLRDTTPEMQASSNAGPGAGRHQAGPRPARHGARRPSAPLCWPAAGPSPGWGVTRGAPRSCWLTRVAGQSVSQQALSNPRAFQEERPLAPAQVPRPPAPPAPSLPCLPSWPGCTPTAALQKAKWDHYLKWGIEYDCPIFHGLFRFCRQYAAASIGGRAQGQAGARGAGSQAGAAAAARPCCLLRFGVYLKDPLAAAPLPRGRAAPLARSRERPAGVPSCAALAYPQLHTLCSL